MLSLVGKEFINWMEKYTNVVTTAITAKAAQLKWYYVEVVDEMVDEWSHSFVLPHIVTWYSIAEGLYVYMVAATFVVLL